MSNAPSVPAAPDPKAIRIRTQAGGTLTNENVDFWLDPDEINPIRDARVIDVYIEQLCHHVNRTRGLLPPAGEPPGGMRAMLSQPQAFYTALLPPDGALAGSHMLRAAGISRAEFQQLEYLFVPINHNEHSSLLALSPVDRTVELADCNARSDRAVSNIFLVAVRFLVHELGSLAGPAPWRFLYACAPRQASSADCGNYTCLYAKALALQWALRADSDLGQGPEWSNEGLLKRLVINDLEIEQWTEADFPVGEEDPVERHYGLDTASEPQHRLFWTPSESGSAAVNLRTLRSRTGRYDSLDVAELTAWCRAQPAIHDENGHLVPRMQGCEKWATLSLREFASRVEERETDILNGLFP